MLFEELPLELSINLAPIDMDDEDSFRQALPPFKKQLVDIKELDHVLSIIINEITSRSRCLEIN